MISLILKGGIGRYTPVPTHKHIPICIHVYSKLSDVERVENN